MHCLRARTQEQNSSSHNLFSNQQCAQQKKKKINRKNVCYSGHGIARFSRSKLNQMWLKCYKSVGCRVYESALLMMTMIIIHQLKWCSLVSALMRCGSHNVTTATYYKCLRIWIVISMCISYCQEVILSFSLSLLDCPQCHAPLR